MVSKPLQTPYHPQIAIDDINSVIRSSTQRRPKPICAPSGIAQLRKSADQSTGFHIDSMNLDDFIFPSNIASPAGLSPSPARETLPSSSNATASAIPIKKQRELQNQELHLSRASAPSVPPTENRGRNEFGYVQKHIRKTSIDERRVSNATRLERMLSLTCYSRRSDGQRIRLMSTLSTA